MADNPDSRTFSGKTDGICLGSSQTVNVVLFSFTCRKLSIWDKYFRLSYLRSGGLGARKQGVPGCGNLVESLVGFGLFGPPQVAICSWNRVLKRALTAA